MPKQLDPLKKMESLEVTDILIVDPECHGNGSVSSKHESDEDGNSTLLSIKANGNVSFRYYSTEKDFLDDES